MRPRISTLNLAPLDAEAADTIALSDTLSRHGWYVRRYFCFGNWYLPCDGLAFDAYMGERDSQLRNTWVRKSKRLLAAGRVRIVDSTAEVESAMDAYDAVYAKSWKQPEPYVDFVRGWARICARNGWLRLGIASVDETPIAAQFWFTVGRRAYIFKLAYDDGQAKWSAGTVLTAHMIRHALEVDRVVEIDYLTGDDAYKKSWMTQRRERVGLMACNTRTVRGLAAAGRELAGELRARVRARAQPEAQRAAATRDTRRPSPESSTTPATPCSNSSCRNRFFTCHGRCDRSLVKNHRARPCEKSPFASSSRPCASFSTRSRTSTRTPGDALASAKTVRRGAYHAPPVSVSPFRTPKMACHWPGRGGTGTSVPMQPAP